MHRLLLLLALVACLGPMAGCVQSPTGPAILYMNVRGPLGPASGTETPKVGRSCARVALALIAWGDASIDAAKRRGGITRIATIDHKSTNVLGFGSFCTIVRGS